MPPSTLSLLRRQESFAIHCASSSSSTSGENSGAGSRTRSGKPILAADVDPARAEKFYAEVRRYWPDLPDGALTPAYAGIRPKLDPAGSPARDFVVEGPERHGVPGLVNLFGIESPGLTASWPVACRAAEKLGLPALNDDLR